MGLHASAPPDKIFQSTLSSRRATKSSAELAETKRFQSTLSSRRATLPEGGTEGQILEFQSTLSSRRATSERRGSEEMSEFQSTLSSRRATLPAVFDAIVAHNFNPRSPHGERRGQLQQAGIDFLISIHALLTESDSDEGCTVLKLRLFQSTLSSRRATAPFPSDNRRYYNFNPRSPHGERLTFPNFRVFVWAFQSTLSSRRATSADARGDLRLRDFNPRSPHGERRHCPLTFYVEEEFQSTLSSRRATGPR